jgi:DNA repair exonuclease SbcCD ATPase subunit
MTTATTRTRVNHTTSSGSTRTTKDSAPNGRGLMMATRASKGERSEQIKALLATVSGDLSGGERAVESVAEARSLIAKTRAEKKRREVMAPTSARLVALEAEAQALRDEVRQLKDENREAIDALLAEAAELAEQTARVDEVEAELDEARELNRRLVSAAQELAELIDESAAEELETKLADKDAEIAELKANLIAIEAKLEDRDELLATIRSLEIELADSYTSAELSELASDNVNSSSLIFALEAENKEMKERIATLLKDGAELPAVAKKYEAAALEVISLKSRIRLLEVQMADMVDQQELNEIIKAEQSKNALVAEVTAQKDDLLKRIRELETMMSDMEDAETYSQLVVWQLLRTCTQLILQVCT